MSETEHSFNPDEAMDELERQRQEIVNDPNMSDEEKMEEIQKLKRQSDQAQKHQS